MIRRSQILYCIASLIFFISFFGADSFAQGR